MAFFKGAKELQNEIRTSKFIENIDENGVDLGHDIGPLMFTFPLDVSVPIGGPAVVDRLHTLLLLLIPPGPAATLAGELPLALLDHVSVQLRPTELIHLYK